jgi:hypothetical protein
MTKQTVGLVILAAALGAGLYFLTKWHSSPAEDPAHMHQNYPTAPIDPNKRKSYPQMGAPPAGGGIVYRRNDDLSI